MAPIQPSVDVTCESSLLHLQLQLTDDLHLDAGLRRALVVQHVRRGHVLQEEPDVGAVRLAARPLAHAVAEERVLACRADIQCCCEFLVTNTQAPQKLVGTKMVEFRSDAKGHLFTFLT